MVCEREEKSEGNSGQLENFQEEMGRKIRRNKE